MTNATDTTLSVLTEEAAAAIRSMEDRQLLIVVDWNSTQTLTEMGRPVHLVPTTDAVEVVRAVTEIMPFLECGFTSTGMTIDEAFSAEHLFNTSEVSKAFEGIVRPAFTGSDEDFVYLVPISHFYDYGVDADVVIGTNCRDLNARFYFYKGTPPS
jgi:hypothetical protein